MAFKYTINVPPLNSKMRCGEIEIFDTTGAYSLATNPLGWGDGTTNPDVSAVTACTGKATFSNGAVWTGSLLDTTLPFPNISGQPTLIKAMLGEAIPDGLCTIESVVSGPFGGGSEGVLGKATHTTFITCNVHCCVQKLGKAAIGKDTCNSKEWKAFMEASDLYEGLLGAIDCKQWNKANEILESLQTLCANENCGCGC